MSNIINTSDTWSYIIIMSLILFSIAVTDGKYMLKRIKKHSVGREGMPNLTAGGYFRELINTYWPTLLGIFGILVFMMMNTRQDRGGYLSLFIVMFMAIFFTSYSLYQWHIGAGRRGDEGTGDAVDTAAGCINNWAPETPPNFSARPSGRTSAGECSSGADGELPATTYQGCMGEDPTDKIWVGEDCESLESESCNEDGCKWSSGKIATQDATENCSVILPESNQFDTRSYKVYRFIYYMTLIVLATCASNNFTGEVTTLLIIGSPIIIPFLTEVNSKIINHMREGNDGAAGTDEDTRAKTTPELLLIHFMRGGHTGITDPDGAVADHSVWQNDQWLGQEILAGDPLSVQGFQPFINSHFLFSFAFYFTMMLLLVIYSQGMMGIQKTDIPIYITLTLMIGFPFFMTYIFIQECSIDEYTDNLPDGKENDQSGKMEDVGTDPAMGFLARLNEKNDWDCIVEKYGGFQTMLCVSLIIMILIRTESKSDKGISFIVIILMTYGLSQTFIASEVYEDSQNI